MVRGFASCLPWVALLVSALPGGGANATPVDFSAMTALGDSLTAPSPFLTYAELISVQLGRPLTNLAVGGTTSASLLAQGQHTRAVHQYHTTFAFLWIGGNDMLSAWNSGELRTAGQTAWMDNYAANFGQALDTLLNGGADVIVANLMDLNADTGFPRGALVPPRYQETVHANMEAYNARLQAVAAARGVPVVNLFHAWAQMLASPPTVYGHAVSNAIGSPYAGRLWMDDIHPNQLGQQILANLFIQEMNKQWGLSIRLVQLPEPSALLTVGMVAAAWAVHQKRARVSR